MKRILIALALILVALPVYAAPSYPDALLDLPLLQTATGTRWDFCTQAATDFTGATSTYTKANVTVTAGSGNGDYTLQNDAANGGRELLLLAQDPITLTGNGTVTHICVTLAAGSTFLGCAPINGVTGRVITDYTTETATYDGGAKFQMRDIQ